MSAEAKHLAHEEEEATYVYEFPVRLWHWVTTIAIFVLSLTGYWIGAPLATQPGEASDNWLMGWIRAIHFIAGYALAISLILRVYWAVVGNKYAREIFSLPVFSMQYYKDVWDTVSFYLLINNHPKEYKGHNPLARASMIGFMFLNLWMIVSGFALYGEGMGIDSWQYRMFEWCFWLAGSSLYLHTLHHLGMWAILLFATVHMYMVFREDVVGNVSSASVMVSGWRLFRKSKD